MVKQCPKLFLNRIEGLKMIHRTYVVEEVAAKSEIEATVAG
jgi:hypothetical protein